MKARRKSWQVYPADTCVPGYMVASRIVSDDWTGRDGEIPTDEDAYLMAAAPELLEASKRAAEEIRSFFPTVSGEVLTQLEAAIAKASGVTR